MYFQADVQYTLNIYINDQITLSSLITSPDAKNLYPTLKFENTMKVEMKMKMSSEDNGKHN